MKTITPQIRERVIAQVKAGQTPDLVVQGLVEDGWDGQGAIDAIEEIMRAYLAEHAREHELPPSVRVPSPVALNGAAVLRAADRDVQVLASLLVPRIIVFGGLLAADECDELIELARARVARSAIVNPESGGDEIHEARTSEGTYFARGFNPLCRKIEARIEALLEWPLENGEGLQILRYGVGAQYRPHYDYFDPKQPGFQSVLKRGGQRVASVVIYLNTPKVGGATTFPDAKFEVGAVKGNAVFFSYDRPHPITKSLHGGAPVLEGEKWVATKWLRESRHE